MLSSNWTNSFQNTNLYATLKTLQHYTLHKTLFIILFQIAFFVMYSEIVFCILVQIRLFRRICTQNCANTIQNRCFYSPSLSSIIYIYIIIINSLEERVSGGTNSFHDTNLHREISPGFYISKLFSGDILDHCFVHKKRSNG